MKKSIEISTCLLLICTLLLAGCSTATSSQATSDRKSAMSGEAVDNQTMASPDSSKETISAVPIRLAILQDKTRSTGSTRTEQMGEDTVNLAIDIVRQTGGEVAYGVLQQRADQPMIRVRIEVPPSEPQAPVMSRNPLIAKRQQAQFERGPLAAFERDRAQWQSITDRDVAEFNKRVTPLLARPANANATDVWDAVRRVDAFLAEPADSWKGVETRNYGLLITDGIDTVHAKRARIASHSVWIVVNGEGSLGVLGTLDPVRFESVKAALLFVAAKEAVQ